MHREGTTLHRIHTPKTMAIAANTHVDFQQSAQTDRPEILASSRRDVVASSPINESNFGFQDLSPVLDSLLNVGDLSVNNRLMEISGINEVLQNGIDIDRMTGIGFHQNLYVQDDWSAAAMDLFVQGVNDGMIGGFHWSDFAEFGAAGNLYKASGVVVEVYECTSKGMTNAWNQKEEQFKQTGENYDLNGDGYSGDAPTGDGCDGKVSLFDSALQAFKDWWNGDGDDNDSDKGSESDPDGCFDMPWLNEQCFSLGSAVENDGQGVMDCFSQMPMSTFGYAQQAPSFQNMPMV